MYVTVKVLKELLVYPNTPEKNRSSKDATQKPIHACICDENDILNHSSLKN